MRTTTKRTAKKASTRKPAVKRTLGAAKKPIDYKLLATLGLKAVALRDVKPEGWFTLSPIEYPKENQVWIKERNGYDRASKTYACQNWGNVNYERFFKGDKIVYQEFIF